MGKRWRFRRLGAVVGVTGLAVTMVIPAARAELDPASNFFVVARADALAVEYLNTAAPVFAHEPVIYGTPATAQSMVDSVGQSTAFAAAPYPGDIMVGLPDNGKGVVAGFGGPPEAIPTYPFYVRSEYPITPEAVQDQSGNRLVARSDQYTSGSEARSGLVTGDFLAALQAQASSRAAVDHVTGAITATAGSRLDAFKVTDALQVGKSTAQATVIKEPGQPAVTESSFTVGSIIIGGVEMGFSDEGFQAGDQSPPSSEPPAEALEPLRQAGITIEFLPATSTESSIDSAGMRITQVQEFGGQTQRISFILGRVSARIEGSAQPLADDPFFGSLPATAPAPADAALPPEPTPSGGGEPSAAEFDALDLVAGDDATFDPVVDLALPAASDGLPGPAGLPAGADQAAPAPREPVRLARPVAMGHGLRDDDASGFYLALAAAGAAMAAAAFFLNTRRRGAGAVGAGGSSVLRLPNG